MQYYNSFSILVSSLGEMLHYIFQTVINMCLNIILSDVASSSVNDSLHNVHHNRSELLLSHHLAAPPRFCSAVVKLMALQMQCLGVGTGIII